MEKNQNVRRLTIDPNTDHKGYVKAIKESGIETNWLEKIFLQKPENLEAMNYAYELSRDEIYHYFKHGIGNSPLLKVTEDPNFQDFSEQNQQSIIDYVQASLAAAKYQYYPEAYGPCPDIPAFKLYIPFTSNEDNSILFTLNPHMEKYTSVAQEASASSAGELGDR